MSFIDKIRSTPATSRDVTVFGFDPDMDTTGWAQVDGTLEKPARGFPIIRGVCLGLIETKTRGLRDLEQTEAMVAAIKLDMPRIVDSLKEKKDAVFVEAQQVYPTPDEDPKTRVAKANDLLRLAQLTGAVQASALFSGVHYVRAVLPATWKGQARKNVTIADLMQTLAGTTVSIIRPGKAVENVSADRLDKLPGKIGHALDALGIALYGIEWISRHEVGT